MAAAGRREIKAGRAPKAVLAAAAAARISAPDISLDLAHRAKATAAGTESGRIREWIPPAEAAVALEALAQRELPGKRGTAGPASISRISRALAVHRQVGLAAAAVAAGCLEAIMAPAEAAAEETPILPA